MAVPGPDLQGLGRLQSDGAAFTSASVPDVLASGQVTPRRYRSAPAAHHRRVLQGGGDWRSVGLQITACGTVTTPSRPDLSQDDDVLFLLGVFDA